LPSRKLPLRAGDILILVRRRNRFFDLVLKALKQAGVPVAGADRLKLAEHLAVMDMMALASFMVLPEDDLTLATVLKGPLFRLSDDDLFKMGYKRKANLFEALKKSPEPRFQAAFEKLNSWLEQADFASPFSFFAKVLHGEGGFETIVSQLGKDAEDPLTSFLNMALEYSLREAASLEGFIGWFNAAVQEIKRDMEQGADAVRIMTVHGAKGLEAPIVFLADSTGIPTKKNKPQLMPVAMPSDNEPPMLVWRKAKNTSSLSAKADEAWLEEQFAEYNRLLYVAMTRAEDGLIVCGALPASTKQVNPRSWYSAVNMALSGHGDADLHKVQTLADGAKFYGTPMQKGAIDAPISQTAKAPLPQFVTRYAQDQAIAQRYLSPSSAWLEEAGEGVEASISQPSRSSEPNSALLRGSLTHALFQYLPSVPEPQRAIKARGYLAMRGGELESAVRDEIAREVLKVLAASEFAPFFNAEALVEAPLIGQLQRITPEGKSEDIVVTGIIDRLVKLPDRWLILDYKTDAAVPPRPEDVARPYVLQMALYQRLLQNLAGAKPIAAALLYTRAPRLHILPDKLLQETLAKQGITAL
jgi:ATP-dependent helicase/nuclease subunit A